MYSLLVKTAASAVLALGASVLMALPASAACGTLYCQNNPTVVLITPPVTTTSSSVSHQTSFLSQTSVSNTVVATTPAQITSFSGQYNGLGPNESLQLTTCPVSVYNPTGAQVLGCYNVVKPQPVVLVPNYVNVVRPVIYVPQPVHVQVPTCGGYYTAYAIQNRGCGG